MREILPGVWHWTAVHDKIKIPVHSYYLEHARVLLDPMMPVEGPAWFRRRGAPESILLTNRHHDRHSARFRKAFEVTVRCHRAGLHEFTHGEKVEPFEFGDELPGRIVALEVGALCPEETALWIPAGAGDGRTRGEEEAILALGDSLIRDEDEALAFVPGKYMGDDPQAVRKGLKTALGRVAGQPFRHLLLAHGDPFVGDGKAALRAFLR